MPSKLLRDADAEKSDRVGFIELFFDLIFVFAAAQLSHRLITHGDFVGVIESLVLFLAVWSVWTGTTWVTNWLDVERNTVRLLLLTLMIGGIFQTLAIPDAFSAQFDARAFAIVHVLMQVGRTGFIALAMRGHHDGLRQHFFRTAIWLTLAAPLWIQGALSSDDDRLAWWAGALAVEYGATAVRYWLPGFGGSEPAEYHVQPAHFAERCGLFVIIALGEGILLTGATVGELTRDWATSFALLTALISAMAMWWIYFSYSAEKGTEAVEHARNPGWVARVVYVYLHIPLICGLLVTAAGDEPLVKHPGDLAKVGEAALILGGPVLFLSGATFVKRYVCGGWVNSHLAGILALLALAPFASGLSLLALAASASGVLVTVAIWEELAIRGSRREHDEDPEEGAEATVEMAEATN
jgi:low temperature requirement protein LtrA